MNGPELQQLILAAFAPVPRPARDEIAPHICQECAELADDLAPFAANEVPEESFRRHVWDMPLLSAEAMHYYFPARLVRGLDDSGPGCATRRVLCCAVLGALEHSEHRWDPAQPYSREQWLAFQAWLSYVEQIADDIDQERIEKARRRIENELGSFHDWEAH